MTENLVVRPYDQKRVKRNLLIIVMAIVVSAMLGYWWGLQSVDMSIAFVQQQQESLEDLSNSQNDSAQQIQNLLLSRDVDKATLELARQDIAKLQKENAAYREELELYRILLRDNELPSGISVQRFTLYPTAVENRYHYRSVVVQKAINIEQIAVQAQMVLKVLKGDELEMVPFSELDTEAEKWPLQFEYKYFQLIEGDITLPDGILPLAIEMTLTLAKNDDVQYQQSFAWKVEE